MAALPEEELGGGGWLWLPQLLLCSCNGGPFQMSIEAQGRGGSCPGGGHAWNEALHNLFIPQALQTSTQGAVNLTQAP